MDARRVAENAARVSYGRLLALLASRSRDIAAAEDALSEAFLAALKSWPERGVPVNPDAWLMTAARNRMNNLYRHIEVQNAAASDLERHYGALGKASDAYPDERLKLLFVCAHPAIDVAMRTPLMMQTVLGLDAQRIANAFLTSPTTMGQRLVRSKSKIRDAGIRFEVPDTDDMPERLSYVLDAIYAAFGQAWDAVPGGDQGAVDMTGEAIFLARLLVSLIPDDPEAKGLLALMLFCEARREARRSADGAFVPLDEQDAALWSREMIIEAEALLTEAAKAQTFGRYQTEAAIQSVHVQRPFFGATNYEALRQLYALLVSKHPSLGAFIGYAGVLLKLRDAEGALGILDELPADRIATYQPYWVLRAHVMAALRRKDDARKDADRAIGLTEDPALREYLRKAFTNKLLFVMKDGRVSKDARTN
jgi:RNA polymerase sigma-70 factor, ECF subfamily